ncbi:MAG: hypothetical protein ACRDY1_04775 [Acidimicrobiales bacterium]
MTTSLSRKRAGRSAVIIGLALVAATAACGGATAASSTTTTLTAATTTTAGGATTVAPPGGASLTKLEDMSSSIKTAETATFAAVYDLTNNDTTQTVTMAQAPPKSLFSVKSGSVIDTGSTTYYCSDSGTSVCVSTGTTNALAPLVSLFSPATVLSGLQQAQAESEAHDAGYGLTFSSGNYAGQSSTCANIATPSTTAKYCVTGQGILAYVGTSGVTFALTSYSASAPAADFVLPAGATVETVPSGMAT